MRSGPRSPINLLEGWRLVQNSHIEQYSIASNVKLGELEHCVGPASHSPGLRSRLVSTHRRTHIAQIDIIGFQLYGPPGPRTFLPSVLPLLQLTTVWWTGRIMET